jgi:hypothetical protein
MHVWNIESYRVLCVVVHCRYGSEGGPGNADRRVEELTE